MLQRDESGAVVPEDLIAHGFLLDVQCGSKAPTPERIAEILADALMWVEGCGEVNVGYMGPMDPIDEEERIGDSVV
jgi:hypothetical protein